LPCLITGRRDNVHAAHIRYGSLRHGKRETGFGEKPDDCWSIPLHEAQHVWGPGAQHSSNNERRWWEKQKIDPLLVAALLFVAGRRGDVEAAEQIISSASTICRTWTERDP
jgi:hypothetical protein